MFHSLIIDEFSRRFDEIREYADRARYSPDGLAQTPDFDVINRLRRLRFLGAIEKAASSLRLSLEAGHASPIKEADGSSYLLMLYLTRSQHAQGGTALIESIDAGPSETKSVCLMRPNRAFVFRSDLWHMALPAGGFGKDARDGRLLFVCSFS